MYIDIYIYKLNITYTAGEAWLVVVPVGEGKEGSGESRELPLAGTTGKGTTTIVVVLVVARVTCHAAE